VEPTKDVDRYVRVQEQWHCLSGTKSLCTCSDTVAGFMYVFRNSGTASPKQRSHEPASDVLVTTNLNHAVFLTILSDWSGVCKAVFNVE
jgi:hypothetical protein